MITFGNNPLQVPRLGYGTAYLTHLGSAEAASKVLGAAFDAGIRYYDTAYMYGGGAAHAFMQPFVKAHRDQIVLTSKVGILPEGRDPVSKIVRKAGRILGEKTAGMFWPKAFPKFHAFSPDQVRTALDASLRDLGTDRLDILMLHEIAASDDTDALWQTLGDLKAQGKFGLLGLATDVASSKAIFARRAQHIDIIQLAHGDLGSAYTTADFPGRILSTHSVLGRDFKSVLALLAQSGKARTVLTDPAFDHVSDDAAAGILMLQKALQENTEGVVLFSSLKPERIRAYASLIDTPTSDDTMTAFEQILQKSLRKTA